MRAVTILMALVLAAAGCLGVGGDSDDNSADGVDSVDANDTQDDGSTDGTGDDSGEHGHEAQPEPHYDNRTGEVPSRTPLIADNTNATEELSLPGTALNLYINLSSESGEIDGEIYPPGCAEQDEERGESCSEDLNTYNGSEAPQMADGGSASWNTQSPNEGNWTVRLFNENTQGDSIPYTLNFYYRDEHEPAPGHHQ